MRYYNVVLIFLMLHAISGCAYYTETVPRQNPNSPEIIYYLSEPQTSSYPIIIMIEGSSSKGRLSSVAHSHNANGSPFVDMGYALITVEQWGIDQYSIDEEAFWSHYTRGQRLSDHRQVIDSLIKNPPQHWDGKFIFWGGSEGGALATQLMILYPEHTLATINWIGAVDWTWEQQFWQFYEFQRAKGEPVDDEIPIAEDKYFELVEVIKNNPSVDNWLGGMTYMYHADAYRQLPNDYTKMTTPLLVVTGAEDSITLSSDVFVKKAKEAGAPITYYRVTGMGHEITQDVVEKTFQWLNHRDYNPNEKLL